MKRFLCAFAFFGLLAARPAQAQRLGYIDTEFIMTKMPEYAQAQTELNKLSDTWEKEIDAQQKDIDKMYRTYQAEEVVLTEPMKKKRQDEMLKKEQELKAYRTKQFGYEGQIFKKRQELNKPAQDKIFEAVEKMVKAKKLDIVLDKASDLRLHRVRARRIGPRYPRPQPTWSQRRGKDRDPAQNARGGRHYAQTQYRLAV
jgi:outer membrane protein